MNDQALHRRIAVLMRRVARGQRYIEARVRQGYPVDRSAMLLEQLRAALTKLNEQCPRRHVAPYCTCALDGPAPVEACAARCNPCFEPLGKLLCAIPCRGWWPDEAHQGDTVEDAEPDGNEV